MAYHNIMMKLMLLPVLSALTKAQSHGLNSYDGLNVDGGSVPDRLDAGTLGLVSNAQRSPNVTRSVGFKPFVWTGDSSSSASIGDVEWTWRVNVSDFAIPNVDALLDDVGGDPTVDTHIVTTTYDFSWPSSLDIPTKLGLDEGLCLTVLDAPTDMPVSLTNAYTKDDVNNTSCVPVLGQACVSAILRSQSSADGIVGVCTAPPVVWSDLPDCQSTLGYTRATAGLMDMATTSVLFSNKSSNATNDLGRGRGWYGSFSGPQNGSASPTYYTAANRLHVIMVNALALSDTSGSPGDNGGGVNARGPDLLCMRVNATQLPTRDPNGDGVTWTSEAVMESIGNSVQTSAVGVLSVLAFSTLVSFLAA